MSHSTLEGQYFGVFAMLVIATALFFALVFLAKTIGNNYAAKNRKKLGLSSYECGPLPQKQANKINSQFFIFALIFILFDIEVIFMYPWALMYKHLGLFALIEMLCFFILLLVGFIYAFKKGALQWQSIN
ncbi:NAD(P)H-quinone oxidoreductase subunit 3 [Campylobacter canadensis]|uniref:NADH-quinone oxidoreductase subunit n=1 Tax=Campylobacter canadensis TaxID=449520 RepID=A0ABS7WPV4_9BACT|nr:NAD(P)H-quinone oxidoreductase subunit 3 [Campylobacter canadensis]MBZ7986798.1 NAD(P)H-quinone oxidoreductase subunit 3 [Campylobacter canadensis]MBZ7995110.1 NAD(P)H-quinone oxidoreductase subunit 3 [Campylobacter canadensis]MBZ7996608.1 NAD(P)H-quinone oxidoreductase subunit 3 [Campylobacter canadensis]MBZ7997835.1 NAD(P)H-quinone oxidoreductase subunit 3 [Campylobacter canadensis]MBZ8000479.1 NAD(P)H-quinone oxidoreductase subunit 3 [Campylobacter canadensis]